MVVRYFDNSATTRIKEEVLVKCFHIYQENMEIHHHCIA